jgi:hypothetical protein
MSSSSAKVASLTGTLLVAKSSAAPGSSTSLHGAAASPPRGGETARAAHRPVLPVKEQGQLTLRLDPLQLRRLRLAAAHLDQTENAVLAAALEHYIDHVVSPLLDGRCSCLVIDGKPRHGLPAIPFGRQKSDLPQ